MTVHVSPPDVVGRRLYDADDLRPLLDPQSVAIIGASSSGKGFGSSAVRELTAVDSTRTIYVVHPRFAHEKAPEGTIGVTSISDLPEPVDCLLVALPAQAVEAAVQEGADRGCKSAIIFSAGFGEVEGGSEAEARLGEIARRTGMRLGGPNTAGILNYHARLPLTFVPELQMDLPPGNLAIVSQSAGLATHLGHRRRRGMGVSFTVSTGNSVDVTALDYVNALLDDPRTDVVLLVIEGLDNPEGLAELGAKAQRLGKPVLALKTGRTRQGERAALSHTGSLAGSYDVFAQAAEDAGIPLFRTVEELIETGQLFARWAHKPYRSGGVAVLTTMGGPGVMAADAADDYGVVLPTPSAETVRRLNTLVPAFAAVGNPIDTTASPTDDVLRQCLEAIAADPGFSAVVMLAASQTGASTAQRPAAIAAAARNAQTPMCAVWLSTWLEAPSSEVLDAEPTLPVFRSSDRCMLAISHWTAWRERCSAPARPLELAGELTASQSANLEMALNGAHTHHRETGPLSEARSRDIIAALDIPAPGARVVQSPDEAAEAAAMIGLPVVAKVVAPNVPHKAAAGGVKIGLRTDAAVRDAYEAIVRDVKSAVPEADLQGVLIAEMVKGGDEFMCGMVRDPVFGPVVVCGAGGGDVEALNDVGRCVGPVTEQSASRALHKVALFQRLKRKSPERAAQLEQQLVSVMQALGAAARSQPTLAEIDLNPVVLREDGTLVSLDALVVRS